MCYLWIRFWRKIKRGARTNPDCLAAKKSPIRYLRDVELGLGCREKNHGSGMIFFAQKSVDLKQIYEFDQG